MTQISPDLSLALGVTSSPGVYALLVGSGISRSAGIPTGWEVVLSLASRLAMAEGVDGKHDPAKWYTSKYGEPPRYSAILERLGPLAAERQSLLRPFFEATGEERAVGKKVPTAAHRAIADLVASGLIHVILTTNFDRLLESALVSAGVDPVVIATADQATGAPPLAHSPCTVIKLHGDYLDSRIKNSDEELAQYESPLNDLLDRVLDEYGLIVCGWSGDYDVALRDALERCPTRRYTTYWCVRGRASQLTHGLITHRGAQVIQITDANSFFTRLLERVVTLRESAKRNPLETSVAVETLKRFLPEERHRIRLRELTREATEKLVSYLNAREFPPGAEYSDDELLSRVRRLESHSELSLALIANGCYWGEARHDDAWLRTIRRLAEFEAPQSGRAVWLGMFRYPALLHIYAAGIAAVSARRHSLLASLLSASITSTGGSEEQVVLQSVFPARVVPEAAAHVLFPHPEAPQQKYRTPLSQYLHRILRTAFADLVPDDREYTEAFDRFEYIGSLVLNDLGGYWPGGCFVWRNGGRLTAEVQREIESAGEYWPPLKAGLFGGSFDRLIEVKQSLDEWAARHRWW